jgi:hypothetical protein
LAEAASLESELELVSGRQPVLRDSRNDREGKSVTFISLCPQALQHFLPGTQWMVNVTSGGAGFPTALNDAVGLTDNCSSILAVELLGRCNSNACLVVWKTGKL